MANSAPQFGGPVLSTGLSETNNAIDVFLQPDGNFVVGGARGIRYGALRFLADGRADPTFDSDGQTLTEVVPNKNAWAYDAALQSDGKILIAGVTAVTNDNQLAAVRFNTNGSLDTTFDGDGKVITSFAGHGNEGYTVAVQADGKIILGGAANIDLTGARDFALVRYNSDGSVDTSFGLGGTVTTDVAHFDQGHDLAIQADGKILLGGLTAPPGGALHPSVLRYNPDGTLDTAFGAGGLAEAATGGGVGVIIALQPDGKVVLGSASVIVRFNSDGTLDTSFGGDGIITSAVFIHHAGTIAVQPDGKIVVPGAVAAGEFAVARYNPDGTLDTAFGVGGVGSQDISLSADFGTSVALLPDGKILVAGGNPSNSGIGVMRFTADGLPDTTWGGLDGAPTFTENGPSVLLDPDVRIFDRELANGGSTYSGATLTLTRHGGANADDVFSAANPVGPLVQGGSIVVFGTTVGTVTTNSGGTLLLTFGANATHARVNLVLQSLTYANLSDSPPASVQIDWTFSDGNTGAQGAGGALAASGHTTVTLIDIPEVINGTSGNDVLTGGNTGDTINGLDGNDYLVGNGGPDTLNGANGNDQIEGGSGADVVDGGAGFDYARYGYAAGPVTVDLAAPALNTGEAAGDTLNSIEGVIGSRFADRLLGSGENNDMAGLDGDDTIDARAGSDGVQGGNGDDTLIGGSGADRLDGGSGTDRASYDTAAAGVLASLVSPSANAGDATGDVYVSIEGLTGSPFDDKLVGNGSVNDLQGGAGNDILVGGSGADRLDGGDGTDSASYENATSGLTASLLASGANTGDAAGDSYVSIENLLGTTLNDSLIGNNGSNVLTGLAGDDYLQALAGNDTLQGGNGADRLEGGAGADTLDGGQDVDYAAYIYSSAGVDADLAQPATNSADAAGDTYLSIEGLIGSNFADRLGGDGQANDLAGLGSDDTIGGLGGNDVLQGGEGNDRLDGGAGADRLIGGNGNDQFMFVAGEAQGDSVLDFVGNGAAAGDTLQFTGYGTAAAGATFAMIDATHWQINSSDGTLHEVLTFSNAPAIDPSDYVFI